MLLFRRVGLEELRLIYEAEMRAFPPRVIPDSFGLRGKDARAQLVALAKTLPYSGMDVICEMAANHVAVFLNFFYWEQSDFSSDGIDQAARDDLLGKLRGVWNRDAHGGVTLGVTTTTATSSG